MRELKSWQKGILIALFPAFGCLSFGFLNILQDLHVFGAPFPYDILVAISIIPSLSILTFFPLPIYFLTSNIVINLSLISFIAVFYWIILGFLIGYLYDKFKTNWVKKTLFLSFVTVFLILHFVFSITIGFMTMVGGT